ncbi:Separin [Cladorrhinum sp. PSN332]|nr:Separin [Cladorrhinum sp. PSN332]
MDTHASQIEAVRSAVSSVATCSPATLALLKNLLLPKDDTTAPAPEDSRKTPIPSRQRTNTLARAPSRRARPGTATPAPENDGLSTRDKATLATQVVNATLKALSEAAKPPPAATPASAPRRSTEEEELVKTATRNSIRRSVSAPMSPLQPRTLNRQSTSPVAAKHTRSPSKATNNTNLLALVECSRVALTALRQIPNTGKVSLPELQLESGMSALIQRLIALNLYEQAIKELRVLKKRLEILANPGAKQPAKQPASVDTKSAAQVFAEIMDFSNVKLQGPALMLAITTQIQTLRVLAMVKKASSIEAVVPHLRQEHGSSPIDFLLSAAKEKGGDAAKLARQIETVAQCLLALTPSVASKDDTVAQEARLSISPGSAVELQAVALEARLQWWSLAKHKGDVEKEIMLPLSRFLGAYMRRSPDNAKANYTICLRIFGRIHQQIRAQGLKPSGGSKLPLANIYQTLVALSRDSQQLSDAISWATKLRECIDPKVESVAKTCSLAAQLLSLQLRDHIKYIKDDFILNEVVAVIQGPLRGDTAELDELLVNICAVRKAAMQVLLVAAKEKGDGSSPSLSSATKELLETFIIQCPRFCLRWLGKPPGPKGSTKDYLRYEQRRQLVLQSLQHILDSAFMIIKSRLDQKQLTWELMDSILSDCITLLEYTCNQGASDMPTSSYVKISHFYYLQYNLLRNQSKDPKDPTPLRALRRSCECVKHRPSAEKEKSQLILKLEQLSKLARTLGRGEEAFGALQSIRSSLIDDGVLTAVAKALTTASPTAIWTRDAKAESLSRALLSLSKMEHVWIDWTVDLPEAEQAAALEHRLKFILLSDATKQADATLEHPVVDTLLRIYIPTRYPVRRLRVLLSLACSALGTLDRASELLLVAKDAAQLEEGGDLGEDSGLSSFIPHMKAFYNCLASAVDGYRNPDVLQQSISAWQSIAKSFHAKADLDKAIDDVPGLLDYLQSVADFLRMKGRDQMLAAVLELMTDISEASEGIKTEEVVQHSSTLAVQYTNLGQSSKAEQVFMKAREHLADNVGPDALVNFHLASAEHHVTLGNFRQAEDHISRARLAYSSDGSLQKFTRSQKKQLVANACYLLSVLALERGDSHHALVYSRESVRAIFAEWVRMEGQLTTKMPGQGNDASIDMSAADMTLQSKAQNPGPVFWKMFNGLFRNTLQISSIYAHLGMFQETMYYAEQAMKIAKSVDSEFYNSQCAAWIGSVSWKAANASKSLEMLQQATAFLPEDERSYLSATLACQISAMYASQNNMEGAELLLAKAEAIMGKLRGPDQVAVVREKMAELQIEEKPARGARKPVARKAPVRKTAASKTAKGKAAAAAAAAAAVPPEPEPVPEDAQLAKLRASILVQKAASMLKQKEWVEAQAVLTEATAASKASDLLPARQLAMASCLLGMSMEQMANDPVFSVIQDSTISFPALSGAEKSTVELVASGKGSPAKKPRGAASTKAATAQEANPEVYVENLRQSHDYLLEAHAIAAKSGDSILVHRISSLLQHVALILTATATKSRATTHSAQTSYAVELARNLTWRRERKAISQEKQALKNDGTEWPPLLHSVNSRRSSLGFTLELHKIQRDYIDIVPKSWNVISISLSEGNHDLCITKLQAGQNPFVIRLPLERASSRDADSDVFNFQQGRSELVEIIKLINETSHAAKDMSVKGAKTEWWQTREALDGRLKELLESIEQIWLGGFRGIFSPHIRREDLLANFQKAFLSTLDKHLPSRSQVRGKKAKASGPKVQLDTNILELFIGLGDATKPDCDFDDELTDLLYFVVDILQFHGERNAYDEIDFDSMVVETFDALQAYHSSANSNPDPSSPTHTILLLDKALHIFPWESLPCMLDQPISRMPSLACLRRLIIDQRSSTTGSKNEGHHASLQSGSYILNPSADLKTTQSTFLPPLSSQLRSWSAYVSKEPTETEFESCLASSDILLYFGHGSGAQYIRGRTIRRLDKCRAAVLLMGCSSAALVEAGEFEPSGPAWNYMMAGSPAVVGTLWDVTDRDIDRFAGRCFEEWGLLREGSVKVDGKGGKANKTKDEAERRSLVEAVARSREACRFRMSMCSVPREAWRSVGMKVISKKDGNFDSYIRNQVRFERWLLNCINECKTELAGLEDLLATSRPEEPWQETRLPI